MQVAWIKLANKGPRGDLAEHGKKLEKDTLAVIQNAKAKFPNLRIAYLAAGSTAATSTGRLNPEPYAYEGAFAVRWLIQDQIKGDASLNYDASKGAVTGPAAALGAVPVGGRHDAAQERWPHLGARRPGRRRHPPSPSGRKKVAEQLLEFFKTDAIAKPWFTPEVIIPP